MTKEKFEHIHIVESKTSKSGRTRLLLGGLILCVIIFLALLFF